MAAINEPKYSKREVSQKFNLKELLGYEPTEEQKKLFYELAVDKMVNRTADGKDINGQKFTRYSEKYAKKKGVSRDSVDLILSGDMLSSFEDSRERKNIIKIKVEEGKETLKSYNHNVGDTLPERTYFGFNNDKDLKSVVSTVDSIKDMEPQTKREASAEKKETMLDLRDAINSLSASFKGFNGDN
jgi:hypothetical protein